MAAPNKTARKIKLATVNRMLRRDKGATLAEIEKGNRLAETQLPRIPHRRPQVRC